MIHKEYALEGLIQTETTDETVRKSIGDLQTNAEQHGEDEEKSHSAVLKEGKSSQTHHINNAFLFACIALSCGTCWESQRIKCQNDAPTSRNIKLFWSMLPSQKVDSQHRYDKTYRAENANGGEGFHRVEIVFLQCVV